MIDRRPQDRFLLRIESKVMKRSHGYNDFNDYAGHLAVGVP